MPRLSHLAGALALCPFAMVPFASGATDPVLLYAAEPASVAIDEGVRDTFRQAPALPNRRWNGDHRLGKVRGKELARVPTAHGMAAALRAGWRSERAVFVGVDEILPAQWSGEAADRLRTAIDLLGADSHRVIFYAGPSMVERVGRADPRFPLPDTLAVLVDAMSRARATYLMTYRGNLQPFPAREMAMHPTRWVARWPASEDQLRLMIGPDGGLGQAALWERVRSTPAGRQLLANGPAAYGLKTRAAGRNWLAQYREFLGNPLLSATGVDARVAEPGGLSLGRPGRNVVSVRIDRPGRLVLRLVPRGQTRGRVIKAFWGPTVGDRGVRLPRDVRPGRYRLVAVLQGDGLRDEARMPLVIRGRR